MKFVFSPSGLKQLGSLRGHAVLFAFDFDGTLSPIVVNSHLASVTPVTRRLLEELADAAPVAVLSGRPLHLLTDRLPANLSAWAGDHGAEIVPGKPPAYLKTARATVRRWTKTLEPQLKSMQGVWLEKKQFSLTVHYRESHHPAAALRAILTAVASLDPPPRTLPGKRVVNLLNPQLPHKGDAVLKIMRSLGLKSALYVGDDSNDEDVFALSGPRLLTIRVGKLATSKATLYLRRQTEINRLLRYLLSLPRAASPRYRSRR